MPRQKHPKTSKNDPQTTKKVEKHSNKCKAPETAKTAEESDLCSKQEDGLCLVSAKTGEGIPKLKKMIHEFFASSEPAIDQHFVLNDRQLELIDKAMNNLEVCQSLHSLESSEIMAEHLKTARGCLNDFVGAQSSDELLGEIFSKFCNGK